MGQPSNPWRCQRVGFLACQFDDAAVWPGVTLARHRGLVNSVHLRPRPYRVAKSKTPGMESSTVVNLPSIRSQKCACCRI